MAPLRAKIGDTFHKLNDKLHPSKRRISEEGDASQQSKQPRTFPGHPPSSSRAGDPAVAAKQPPSSAGPHSQPTSSFSSSPNPTAPYASTSSPVSLKSAGMTNYSWDDVKHGIFVKRAADTSTSPGSSATHPIDLTATSASSAPSNVSPDSSARKSCIDPMDLSGSSCSGDDQTMQLLADEKYAKALQDQLNRDPSDGNRSSWSTSIDGGVFGPPQDLGANFDPAVYREHLLEMRCKKCGNPTPVSWEVLVSRTKEILKSGIVHPFILCSKCKVWSCAGMGCNEILKDGIHQLSAHITRPNLKISWCCDAGRLFLIFSLACGPNSPPRSESQTGDPTSTGLGDRLRTRFRSKSEQSCVSPQPPKLPGVLIAPKSGGMIPKPPKFKPPKSTAISQLSKGTGYGGPEQHHPFMPPTHPSFIKTKIVPKLLEEKDTEGYFSALSAILPCYSRDKATDFDYSPQSSVTTMLPRSPLLQKASELLRQHGFEEMGSQHSLYSALLDLLHAMTGHSDILPLLYSEQRLYSQSEQLAPMTFSPATAESASPTTSKEDMTQSLDALLQALSSHCLFFVQVASSHLDESKSTEEKNLLILAKHIMATAQKVEETRLVIDSWPREPQPAAKPPVMLSNVSTRSRVAREAESAAHEKINEELGSWHRQNCVQELPDDKILGSFYFADKVHEVETGKSARGRMRKLVTQIASLRSSLPEGIYVRHGASRLDIMKILIVGPKDTPYEHGLFEFDLFCNKDFPLRPPDMQFRTTGGGKVGFNPNLYNNGKVCLSLLGTWTGQGWEPDRSTILQILVSIQAMVFNSQPWYNEPGRETHLDETQSKSYNRQIWQHTVRLAMLYWLNERLSLPEKDKGKAPLRSIPNSKRASQPQASQPPSGPSGPHLPPLTLNAWPSYDPCTTFAGPAKPSQPTNPATNPSGPLSSSSLPPLSWISTSSQTSFPPPLPKQVLKALPWPKDPLQFAGTAADFPDMKIFDPSGNVDHVLVDYLTQHYLGEGTQPIGNTAVDSKDDVVWGPVIRKHFSLKAAVILTTLRKCQFHTDSKLLKELEETLRLHNFLQ